MRVAVLGTGNVGRTLGSKLVELGHQVVMGSRSADNPAATEWVAASGPNASQATFAEATAGAEVVINATSGLNSLAALKSAGSSNLDGKVLIDVANPLDFSRGMPPSLGYVNDTSLGEEIQKAHPRARVVKALNTMNCGVMVDPSRVPAPHEVFICGNDATAKEQVRLLLGEFGWPAASILDLGDITGARGMESYVPFWVRLMMTVSGGRGINIHVSHEPQAGRPPSSSPRPGTVGSRRRA